MKKVHWTSLIECNYQPNSRKKLPMNSLNSTISSHQKGQHLALQDRVIIQVLRSQYQEHWHEVFKTITTDNGSEFADLAQLEEAAQTLVYYAHPYTSYEKDGVERHNRLIRRFIPKGKYIKDYDLMQIYGIEEWCNNLPRKILAYHTPDELYERRLDCIYQIK